jgi:hypothetical protein
MNGTDADPSRTVVVATAPNELVARMWQELLHDAGIIAALKPGGPGHAFATTALIEHYILVLSDQAERARAIITEFESSDEANESGSSD